MRDIRLAFWRSLRSFSFNALCYAQRRIDALEGRGYVEPYIVRPIVVLTYEAVESERKPNVMAN